MRFPSSFLYGGRSRPGRSLSSFRQWTMLAMGALYAIKTGLRRGATRFAEPDHRRIFRDVARIVAHEKRDTARPRDVRHDVRRHLEAGVVVERRVGLVQEQDL